MSTMLRAVTLPDALPRGLFLSRMPGRAGPFAEECELIRAHDIETVVCLTSVDEVRHKAPDYAQALTSGTLPWVTWYFPIQDFGVPEDKALFLALARDVAASLQRGVHVLIHCGAGIGRTGTLAACALVALGMTREAALAAVDAAGAGPETPAQSDLLAWVSAALGEG